MVEKKEDPNGHADENGIQPSVSNTHGQSEILKSTQDGVLDEAATFLANADAFPPMTPEMEKRIVKKIDAWMIPLVWLLEVSVQLHDINLMIENSQLLFTATLGAVDKVQMGTASLYGFQTDNNFVGQQYSWLGSVLPLGVSEDHRITLTRGLVFKLTEIAIDRICCCFVSCSQISASKIPLRIILAVVCPDITACSLPKLVRLHGTEISHGLH